MERWNHILVVDCNPYVRELVSLVLETPTCRITGVADGQAMREFLRTDDSVDLVIIDCPGDRSSSDALYLRRLGMPFVMMSGNPDMMLFAVENGLQMVGKPFEAAQLRAATEWACIPQHKESERRDVHQH